MMLALALVMLLCAGTPATIFLVNLRLYRQPDAVSDAAGEAAPPAISILIPARNEAHGIEAAIRAALLSSGVVFEVVVMDDASTDGTAKIVQALALKDIRVRLEHAPALPAGWNGKQHACWALAQTARHPVLCFVDADVRLAPECVNRMAAMLERGGNGLVSGFPRQITGTTLEWLLLPLIHFVLLCFLPIGRMRAGAEPAFAAGCGQFLMARADRYFACGGHSGIKLTMHDGLRLPRLFREHGFRTDLADLTELATCRMYTSATQVWSGLAKNAVEGIAAPVRIVPITILLLLGQVLPFLCLLGYAALLVLITAYQGLITDPAPARTKIDAWIVVVSCLAAWTPRMLGAERFRQDRRSALLHPIGILILLAIQWYALTRKLLGCKVSWKSRAYVES